MLNLRKVRSGYVEPPKVEAPVASTPEHRRDEYAQSHGARVGYSLQQAAEGLRAFSAAMQILPSAVISSDPARRAEILGGLNRFTAAAAVARERVDMTPWELPSRRSLSLSELEAAFTSEMTEMAGRNNAIARGMSAPAYWASQINELRDGTIVRIPVPRSVDFRSAPIGDAPVRDGGDGTFTPENQ